MSRYTIPELISACDQLIAAMQAGDQRAIDTARGLLWHWVDGGNSTELTNLLGAIRLLAVHIHKRRQKTRR